jgi:hypothetical protein
MLIAALELYPSHPVGSNYSRALQSIYLPHPSDPSEISDYGAMLAARCARRLANGNVDETKLWDKEVAAWSLRPTV